MKLKYDAVNLLDTGKSKSYSLLRSAMLNELYMCDLVYYIQTILYISYVYLSFRSVYLSLKTAAFKRLIFFVSVAETGGVRYQHRTVPYRDETVLKKKEVGRYGTVRYG